MKQPDHIYIPLLIDFALIVAIVAWWHALAFAQCMPNDLNCMNLP